MGNKGIIVVAIIIVIAVFGSLGGCDSSSSSSSKYSGYSNTYKNDAEYRENVKDIANAYGMSEKEVDKKINAITGGR